MKKHVLALVLLITMLIGGTQTYAQSVTITPAAPTICSGSNQMLQAIPAGGFPLSYLWSTGAGGSSITVSPGSTTSYTVTATLTTGTATASVTVTVNPTPTATISGASSFCQGSNTTLTSSTTGGVTTYQWRLNGGNIALATNPTYVVSSAGSYDLVVNNGACGATSNIIVITQNPLPIVITTPLPNDTITICSGSSTVFSTTFNAAYTYQWQSSPTVHPGTWTNVPGATSNTYTVSTLGHYMVKVTLNGCTLDSNW